jgi:hypothetical protein
VNAQTCCESEFSTSIASKGCSLAKESPVMIHCTKIGEPGLTGQATAGADCEESCGKTANVSPLKAEEPEEVRRINEDLPRLAEAGLAAELTPDGCGLGKVAGGDVVPDLIPFGRRQYPP